MPPTIAVDLDEVLGSFIPQLCIFHNEKYNTNLLLSDFHSYRFCEVWGGDDAEATEKVHDFFKTKHFLNIPVVPGAKEAMLQLRAMGFDLVVVTSRQLAIQDATRKWLNRHFPSDLFREVAFGNHWGLEGRKIRKVDLCRELQASVLIDDSLTYVREVADAGMKAILFDLDGTYGWNKSDELPEGVTRLQDWEQVIDHLRRL